MAALCFWPWQGWGSVWGEGRARIPALPLPGSAAEPAQHRTLAIRLQFCGPYVCSSKGWAWGL